MTKPLIAVVVAVSVWVLLLPGLLIRDRTGSLNPPWRALPFVLLAVVVAGVGVWLVWAAASRLTAEDISPFAAHPGPVLVTDGIYGRVRNPMDLGNTLIALSPVIAVPLSSMWVVPLAAFLYYLMGTAPLENRYLRAKFGESFEDYRARVPVWTPLWNR